MAQSERERNTVGKAHLTRANGTSISWGEMGKGDPLILLHGIYDSHRTWRRAAPLLAKHFRVLMPDLPGHGYSGRPDAPYTLAWHAHTLIEWMDAVKVPTAHVAGHSYGGGVAQWMLLEKRKRVRRLALVSSGGLGREVAVGMRLASFPFFGPLIAPALMKFGAPIVLRLSSETFGHMEPEEIERHVRMNRIPGTSRAFQRTVAGTINPFGQYMQTWQRINEVKLLPPMALFWGEKDPILPVRHARIAQKKVAGALVSIYPKCGHYPHLDEPSRFAGELVQFLNDRKRGPARLRTARTPWRNSIYGSRFIRSK